MSRIGEYISREPQMLQLETNYGSCLERLPRKDKLALRAVLAHYLYYRELIEQYQIVDAITDTMPDLDAEICNIIRISLSGISRQNAEGLIEFITAHQPGRD